MKVFIARLFLILLFVNGYITDDAVVNSHIVNGFLMSFIGYTTVYAICKMIDEDGEFLFPWVAGILNVILILVIYSYLFL